MKQFTLFLLGFLSLALTPLRAEQPEVHARSHTDGIQLTWTAEPATLGTTKIQPHCYYRNNLEAAGIATLIRNEHLVGAGMTEVPIPEFFPTLCVTNVEEYTKALKIMKQQATANETSTDLQTACPSCGGINPGNFDSCWSCEGLLKPVS